MMRFSERWRERRGSRCRVRRSLRKTGSRMGMRDVSVIGGGEVRG